MSVVIRPLCHRSSCTLADFSLSLSRGERRGHIFDKIPSSLSLSSIKHYLNHLNVGIVYTLTHSLSHLYFGKSSSLINPRQSVSKTSPSENQEILIGIWNRNA